ncbi:hypothetical protein BKA80DRAFT_272901 [Phyllosticta citrichinensis]
MAFLEGLAYAVLLSGAPAFTSPEAGRRHWKVDVWFRSHRGKTRRRLSTATENVARPGLDVHATIRCPRRRSPLYSPSVTRRHEIDERRLKRRMRQCLLQCGEERGALPSISTQCVQLFALLVYRRVPTKM